MIDADLTTSIVVQLSDPGTVHCGLDTCWAARMEFPQSVQEAYELAMARGYFRRLLEDYDNQYSRFLRATSEIFSPELFGNSGAAEVLYRIFVAADTNPSLRFETYVLLSPLHSHLSSSQRRVIQQYSAELHSKLYQAFQPEVSKGLSPEDKNAALRTLDNPDATPFEIIEVSWVRVAMGSESSGALYQPALAELEAAQSLVHWTISGFNPGASLTAPGVFHSAGLGQSVPATRSTL